MPHKFSRSHQVSLHTCPRLAWLRYWDRGKGWDTRRMNVAQSTGSLLHSIIGSLLAYVRDNDAEPMHDFISQASAKAVADYRQEAMQRGLDIEQVGELEFELQRQSILAEGMARGWVLVRLPLLIAKYKVICVEEEWEIPLDPKVTCMVRIDAVLEDRESGDLWAFEMKTTGWMSDDWLEKWRYDSQTLMHAWAIEKRFPHRQVGGVLVEAFYKGTKRKGDDGRETYYSPYLRAYRNEGVGPFSETTWSYDSSNARRKGWEVVEATSYNDVARWVAQMPPDVIQQQIYSVEVFRNPKEQRIWEAQTLAEQQGIAASLQLMDCIESGELSGEVQDVMDDIFPARMNASCYSNQYRKKCPFLDVCFNGVDPAESEAYMERVPHHSGEFEE